MLTNATFAFMHHISAFILFASLFYQFLVFKPLMHAETIHRLGVIDRIYGISAGLVLVIGLLRVFYFEKSEQFYLQSPAFWVKLGLFFAVAIISIYPTIKIIQWRKKITAENLETLSIEDKTASHVKRILHLELIGLVLILLAAVFMARGIGL